MATIKDTLKEINKNIAEADQFKVVSERSRDYFDNTFCSTGSPYLDFVIGGKEVMMGIPMGRMTLITGWQGAGKSSFALLAASEMQKQYGKFVVYLDGESTVDNSYLDRLGLDREKLIVQKESVLEPMLDSAKAFSRSEDVGMIVIDTVKAFTSKVVEDKPSDQMTIGIEAKKYGTGMNILNSNCARRGIALVVLNQWREDPGSISPDARVLPGGHWQKFLPSLHLDFTKKTKKDKVTKTGGLILDENKAVVGHTTDVRIKKSKFGGYDGTIAFPITFYYDYGFNKTEEYTKYLIEKDIIHKGGGGNYTFPNGEKAKGLSKVLTFVESNPEYLKELLNGV